MGIISKVKLIVKDAPRDGQYNDIVWVHYRHRKPPTPKGGKSRRSIKVGTLVNVSFELGGKRVSRVLSIRGVKQESESEILIDHVNRTEMRLNIGETHEFTLRTTHWWEKVVWACTATDPGIRIASWMAVGFGVLGIIGTLIAAIGLYPVVKEIRADWIGSHAKPAASAENSPSTSVASPLSPAIPLGAPAAEQSGVDKP